MSVDVCIVVVTYNSSKVIDDLLDSLPAASGALSTEVIVVDNGSSDGTAELVERRGDCTVIRSTNEGYAGGLMRGIAAGTSFDAVLVLNPDARLDPGCLPIMKKALDLPATGIVAPLIRSQDGTLFHSLRREPSLLRTVGLNRLRIPLFAEAVLDDDAYSRPAVADWALGAVLLMSAECLERVGGWDVSYFLYAEETDFCLRARDLGYLTRFEPAATAMHIGGGSGRNDRTYTMQAINRVRLFARRNNRVRAWIYYGLVLGRELVFAALGRSQARAASHALLHPGRRPTELGCSNGLLPR